MGEDRDSFRCAYHHRSRETHFVIIKNHFMFFVLFEIFNPKSNIPHLGNKINILFSSFGSGGGKVDRIA